MDVLLDQSMTRASLLQLSSSTFRIILVYLNLGSCSWLQLLVMEYFVDKILQHRGNPKKSSSMEFEVSWLNYPPDSNTWELLPAIFFTFSRKNVETFAKDITTNLLEDDSKKLYQLIFSWYFLRKEIAFVFSQKTQF